MDRVLESLEDYLLFPLDPAPKLAADIEARMAEIGDGLFRAVLHGSEDARDLWAELRPHLAETRVEVVTDVRHAAAIPWELLRDPKTATPLALRAQSFVRAHPSPSQRPRGAPDDSPGGPIRILLVICRPRGGKDVPFRSVAARLLKGLDDASREIVALEVLRPPTFEVLAKTLRAAKNAGKPYHVVHFDGHGAYLDDEDAKELGDLLSGVSQHVLDGGRKGKRGYLLFEAADETAKEDGELVGGPTLGALLVETGVPVLVLNACRSAHADPPPEPEKKEEGATDTHADVASFGSLALEVMDKGVSGVVAMRYNVYVVTAAQFVADLYGALADGLSLGEAVSLGRKQLAARPERTIGFDPVQLQDWCVPVVYEAERLPLFPAPPSKRTVKLGVGGAEGGAAPGALVGVPEAPDVGFFGRDETLLALDRAFDRHPIVLLHAYAGSGKTSTAAEFARWYARTGGVEGPVLWSSFERRTTLAQALEVVGRVFEPLLQQNRIEWLALSEGDRRRVALQILGQVPVLWVWDNVEPVAGFPEGAASAWTPEEQAELVGFLREARKGKARFLLTSRRDEQGWLRELPARVEVPPMPMQERVQLARALASLRRRKLGEVKDWRPLLLFTQGNPMTITVLVGQALRDGVRTKEQVEAFVAKLRAGEKAFADDAKEGRSRSLGASLSYGFGEAFGEEERKVLALLHLFQGFVQADTLRVMGAPGADWCLPELQGLTREQAKELLNRAGEIGLLMSHGLGRYSIHPAMPWYLRGLFEKYYPFEHATLATRAFVEAMGMLGDELQRAHQAGYIHALDAMAAEEANFIRAYEVAYRHGWWPNVISTMRSILALYRHRGRRADMVQFVEKMMPRLIDPETDGPLANLEDEWLFINGYRAEFATEARQWDEAERLYGKNVELRRRRVSLTSSALEQPHPDATELRNFASDLANLGDVQIKLQKSACIVTFTEAAEMAERAGDLAMQATIALKLGHAYKDVAATRDLDEAERWYRRSLSMRRDNEPHGHAACFMQLGAVALARFDEALARRAPRSELARDLDGACHAYGEALDLLPADAIGDLAVAHLMLGSAYGRAGDVDRAMAQYQESIRNYEDAEDIHGAGGARFNAALALGRAGRLADARAYAAAAARDFETYGDHAADDIANARRLIADIDRLLSHPKPP